MSLAKAIGEPQKTVGLRQGNVVSVTSNSYTVTLGGAVDTISGVKALASVSVAVNDTIWLLQNGDDLIIIGKLNPGTPGSTAQFSDGVELYHASSTPYIDFHRGASPTADAGADYNVRLINDEDRVLKVYGGSLQVDSNMATNIRAKGAGAGFHFEDRSNAAQVFAWYATAGVARLWSTSGAEGLTVATNGNVGIRNPSVVGTVTLDTGAGGGVSTVLGMRDNQLRLRLPNDANHYLTFHAPTDGVELYGNASVLLSAGGFQVLQARSGDVYFHKPINTDNRRVYFGGVNDGAYSIYRRPADATVIEGWQNIELRIQGGSRTVTFTWNGGWYTNFGWGIGGTGRLESGVYGANTGGALGSKSAGGNTIRFDWSGGFQMWVDVTHVKTFVIDHPSKKDHHLIHGALEGPEAAVFYRGEGQLDNGWVEIALPDYFEDLCAVEGRSVQLTCIADDPADEWCPVLHATYPKNGKFYVGLGSGMVTLDQRFWWEVTAVRKDVKPLLVEPAKKDVTVMGQGPYTYYKEK